MSKTKCLALIFSLIISVFPQVSFGQSDKAKKIDEFITPFIKANQFSGQILAAENGKIIYEKAFGLANADFKIPNQLNTRIGIASITKQMTTVILNRLIEEKKISPADKLAKYIPDFPNGDKITIDMLANHRAGIPHRVIPPEEEAISYTSAEFIEKIKQAKLDFEPGAKTQYSSGGYSVLARTLEIASGKSYAGLLQEYVFTPAGMTDSLDFNGEMIIERRAQDYFLSPNGYVNAPLKDYSFLVGAGSVFGTARDVYKFGEAVLDGKYGEKSKTSLLRQTTLSGSGATNGHRAYFEIEREKKYGYVLVANLPGAFDMISQGVTEILQGTKLTVKPFDIPKFITVPNKDLTEFTGRYKRDNGSEWNIILKDNYLYSGGNKFFPIKPNCFFEYAFFAEVCFNRDDSGKIKELKWKGINFELTGIRQ
jgi:CubicO group peptidase (beta-lactamase class C family)